MKKHLLTRMFCAAMVLIMALSLVVQAGDERARYGQKLDLLSSLLKQTHLDMPEDADPVRDGLLKMFEENPGFFETFVNTMFQNYDPYSYYMEGDTYQTAFPSTTPSGGIGIGIQTIGNDCLITSVTPDSPAAKAGLLPGDILLAVDGKSVIGYTATMIADLIKGEIGKDVKLTVLREKIESVFTVTRASLQASDVTFRDMGDGVAYLKISRFSGLQTFTDFCSYYDTLPEQGFKSVILDVRSNPGGSLDCLINILNQIIPDADMPYLQLRSSNPMRLTTHVSDGLGWQFNSMVILVNESSASASEILAGSLKDLGYAKVVGVTTRGKGLGQNHYKLTDGSFAIVSTQEIILPLTGNYNGYGVKPDYRVELESIPFEMPELDDLDLNRGVYRTMSNNVRALEQRLKVLGHFNGTPDEIADESTFHSVNLFQRTNGLDLTVGYCDTVTVRAIHHAIQTLDKAPTVKDTQLEKALFLARKGAKSDEKPVPIAPEQARFVSINR